MSKLFGGKKKSNQSMNFVPSLTKEEFVRYARIGSLKSTINIAELPDYVNTLLQGIPREEIPDVEQFAPRLHAECPKCGTRLSGQGIMMVTSFKGMGHVMFGGGSQMTQRVLEGKCANVKCKSTEIILEWL